MLITKTLTAAATRTDCARRACSGQGSWRQRRGGSITAAPTASDMNATRNPAADQSAQPCTTVMFPPGPFAQIVHRNRRGAAGVAVSLRIAIIPRSFDDGVNSHGQGFEARSDGPGDD